MPRFPLLLRLALALILAASLPLQGIAASKFVCCADRDAASIARLAALDGAAAHPARHEPCHAASGTSDSKVDPGTASTGKANASTSGETHHGACACAGACAMVAALPAPSLPGVPAIELGRTPSLTHSAGAPAFFTTGIDRPPRPIAA